MDVSELVGRTMKRVDMKRAEQREDDEIVFETVDGRCFKLYHDHDCCESVTIEDVCGNLEDLVGLPLAMAEESTSDERPKDKEPPRQRPESETWTFYRFATAKGYVTIRWWGRSNGYYSEAVHFAEITAR